MPRDSYVQSPRLEGMFYHLSFLKIDETQPLFGATFLNTNQANTDHEVDLKRIQVNSLYSNHLLISRQTTVSKL